MHLYIDESGSFVPSTNTESWNVVAALAVPEATRKTLELALTNLKMSIGKRYSDEIKLKNVPESNLKHFLSDIANTNALTFASCMDLGRLSGNEIIEHQDDQVKKILANRPRMRFEEGRRLIDDLAGRVQRLSPQLYAQFVVQIDIIEQVYRSTILYYSQHCPATLSRFRWQIDEKNPSRPLFEETLRHMAPPILQSRSVQDPAIFVYEFDYSHFDREFAYAPDEIPTYLEEETGVKIGSAANLGKVLKDFKFVRSHDVPGVQIADILASSFRRVLRNNFEDNLGIAEMLGRITVERAKPKESIHLISLSDNQHLVDGCTTSIVRSVTKASKKMIRRHPRKNAYQAS